jgi:hypothetical protein
MGGTPLLRRRSLAVLALAVLIGTGAATAWFVASRDQVEEPRCQPAGQNARHPGCIASVPIRDILISENTTIALMPDGGTLLAAGVTASDLKSVLVGLRATDGYEDWRVPLEGPPEEYNVSVSASGGKAAVWPYWSAENKSIHIVHVPGGAPLVDVPLAEPFIHDVAFSADEAAIVTEGRRGRTYPLSNPTAQPATAPTFDEAKCGSLIGRSNIGSVLSRDNRIVVFLLNNEKAPMRLGVFSSIGRLSAAICGAERVAVLDAPAGWPHAKAVFVSFSPNDDRLAVIHVDQRSRSSPLEWSTLLEIWDTDRLSRLAAFRIRGLVGYRMGWSQDGHRLAVVRSGSDGTVARIYEIP